MKKFNIFLKSIIQAKNFCDAVNNFDFDIELSDGKNNANAKDIMDILSLDLSDAVTVTFYTEATQDFEETIKEFIK